MDNLRPMPVLPIATHLRPAVLDLNNRHAVELSWLEPEALGHLLGEAFHARRIGEVEAFMISFDQDAAYESPNFLWFRQRYFRFVYVDRIVVDPAARGRGHARRLYHDLFEKARRHGHALVTCEVNITPPNPASHAFHGAAGFVEVGSQAFHDGAKSVRYYARRL